MHLWTIMDESALHRVVGSPDIMRVQRGHLADMARQPNVMIQVIPDSAGVTCAYGKAFSILTSNSNSTVVYLEDVRSAHYLRDQEQVAEYSLRFDYLRAMAYDDVKSLKLIEGVKE